jgi:hypothetical protein
MLDNERLQDWQTVKRLLNDVWGFMTTLGETEESVDYRAHFQAQTQVWDAYLYALDKTGEE